MTDRVAVISCDTDWAEEETLWETHDLLCSLGRPITYFVTRRYGFEDAAPAVPLEIGPHPSFEVGEPELSLRASMAFSPGAVSFRAHALYYSSRLRPLLREQGIRYSSSAMMYLQPGLRTYEIGYQLTEVPLFWMDSFHLEYCELAGRSAHQLPAAELSQPGLKVLAVHPVHLALNTESREHYRRARHLYHDPAGLRREQCRGPGMRDLFLEIVAELERLEYRFVLVRDAAAALAGAS